ncbi:hypothetical protein Bhyg_03202, partial [Pseudolycoriella hygida]
KSGSQGRKDRKENLRSEVAQVKGQLKISHLFTKPPLSLQQQTTKDTDRLDTGSTAVKDHQGIQNIDESSSILYNDNDKENNSESSSLH